MTRSAEVNEGDVSLALTHAWNWFSLHAAQRMQAVNFFLVAVAFLSTAYVAALNARRFVVSASIAALGLVATFAFTRLEARTRELVRVGEAALREIEKVLSTQLGTSSLQLVEAAEPTKRSIAYSWAINLLHRMIALGFLVGTTYALYSGFRN